MRRLVPIVCAALLASWLVVVTSPPALAKSAVAIGTGTDGACVLTAAEQVWCWGETPTLVPGFPEGVAVLGSFDAQTWCAVANGGAARCWGGNGHGQIGDGTTEDRVAPVDVAGLSSGVAAIAAGENHACAVTEGGAVTCWGHNGWGQLGDGTTTEHHTPVDVVGLSSGVVAIAASPMRTCALTEDGAVLCWGAGTDLTPTPIPTLDGGVQAIAVGDGHSCALTDGGGVRCWGDNHAGALGDGTGVSSDVPVDVVGLSSGVTAIAAGFDVSCAVLVGGDARCWGANFYGQLGDGTSAHTRLVPVDVIGLEDGATAIATAAFQTCAVTTDGGAMCWGHGRLANGVDVDQWLPFGVWGFAGDAAGRSRPDATIAASAGAPFVGDDVYTLSGWRQTVSATIGRGEVASFPVRLRNDGTAPDRYLLQGTFRTRDLRVDYYLRHLKITWKIIGEASYTPWLQPGEVVRLRIEVSVRDPAREGATKASAC